MREGRCFSQIHVDLQVVLLGIYWVFAGSSFVLPPFVLGRFGWEAMVELTGLVVAVSAVEGFTIHLVRHHRIRELIATLPGLIALFSGATLLVLTGSISLRTVFCASFIGFTFAAFTSVLYSEDVERRTRSQIELMHHRYLEYFRNYLWIVAFVTVGYLAWELQALSQLGLLQSQIEALRALTIPAGFAASYEFLWVGGFLQLAFTVGTGMVLVVYGFHVKLGQIEAHASQP